MNRFVCVRMVQANGIDLSLFEFDYDLTFAAMFLNADGTIYGRFGSRSDHKEATRDISLVGFRESLSAALELHARYPANKASLAGKKGRAPRFAIPEEYPSLREKYSAPLADQAQTARNCIHCHQLREAERLVYRTAGKEIPEEVLFPWPMPDVIGLTLDRNTKATVAAVVPDSPAAVAGFHRGDELLTLSGQPMLSLADVQWVLQQSGNAGTLVSEIRRNGQKQRLTLSLPEGWRRRSNISWRATTWDLRRMATGGLLLADLSAEQRRAATMDETQLALRVDHVGEYGAHAAAKKAGFLRGDILVAFDGRSKRMSESQLLAYVLQQRSSGTRVPVTVLRGEKRIELELPMQ